MKPEIPRYMRPLLRSLRDRQIPPGLHDVKVFHDGWCAIWSGGVCNCNPDVQLSLPGKN